MSDQTMYQGEADLYDLIYGFKNYPEEAERVRELVTEHQRSSGRRLLDVACGTGKHLEHLVPYFNCVGVDLNPAMLEIARRRLPGVTLLQADMTSMRLGEQFDVVTCLFSAIGYVRTQRNLSKVCHRFAEHLALGGVVIIEPWISPENWLDGAAHMQTYDGPSLKMAWLNVSRREGRTSFTHFHWLVAEEGKGVRRFEDSHVCGLFSTEEQLAALERAGFEALFIPDGLMRDRGLLLGVKVR